MRWIGVVALAVLTAGGARGPCNPEAWAETIDTSKTVHFVCTDGTLRSPGGAWVGNLKILAGGDHDTAPVTIGGHTGVRVLGIKFNTADDQFPVWAQEHTIDILMQVYGDDAF